MPEHLVRHVGIRYVCVADHHGHKHARLLRVRLFARQVGAVLPSAIGGYDHEPGHELCRHRPRKREGECNSRIAWVSIRNTADIVF